MRNPGAGQCNDTTKYHATGSANRWTAGGFNKLIRKCHDPVSMDGTLNSGSDEIMDLTGDDDMENIGKDDLNEEIGNGMYVRDVTRQQGEGDAVLEEAGEEEVFNTVYAVNTSWWIYEIEEEEEDYMYGSSEVENGGHGSLPPSRMYGCPVVSKMRKGSLRKEVEIREEGRRA